jgi:hypothetical protein
MQAICVNTLSRIQRGRVSMPGPAERDRDDSGAEARLDRDAQRLTVAARDVDHREAELGSDAQCEQARGADGVRLMPSEGVPSGLVVAEWAGRGGPVELPCSTGPDAY